MPHGIAPTRATRSRRAVSLFFLALSAGLAQAHVTLETPQARAGTSYEAVLRVGHGCAGSPITPLIVDIPEGVRSAKPMPKPGWRIENLRARLARPCDDHGRQVSEDVAQIRYVGEPLPDSDYDEFALQATLPAPGQKLHDLKNPAALLEVTADEHAAHQH